MRPYDRDQQIELMKGARERIQSYVDSQNESRTLATTVRRRANEGNDDRAEFTHEVKLVTVG